MSDEVQEKTYTIPTNYKNVGKWKNISIRNLLEGIAVFFIVWLLFNQIPLLRWQFKIGLILLVGGGLAILFVIGVNGKSLTKFLIDYIKFVYAKKKDHFPGMEAIYGEATSNRKDSAGSTTRESKFDQLIRKHKSRG